MTELVVLEELQQTPRYLPQRKRRSTPLFSMEGQQDAEGILTAWPCHSAQQPKYITNHCWVTAVVSSCALLMGVCWVMTCGLQLVVREHSTL